MKIGETATLLGVSDNTVRNWVSEFEDFFSPNARKERGRQRTFTEADVLVLATIATLRNDALEFSEIQKRLNAGFRVEHPGVANFGVDTRMVPTAAVEQLIDATELRIELEQVRVERDKLLDMIEQLQFRLEKAETSHKAETTTLQKRIEDLIERAARAEMEAMMLREQLGKNKEGK